MRVNSCFSILYNEKNRCIIISQIITLVLHVSTLLCHPQGVRSLYLATKIHWAEMESCLLRASKYCCFFILYNEPTDAQLFHKLSHCCYMFRHYCLILREFVVSAFPSYTSMSDSFFSKFFFTFVPCTLILSKFYLFTN